MQFYLIEMVDIIVYCTCTQPPAKVFPGLLSPPGEGAVPGHQKIIKGQSLQGNVQGLPMGCSVFSTCFVSLYFIV